MASVRRSFSSHVSLSSAMIFSVSCWWWRNSLLSKWKYYLCSFSYSSRSLPTKCLSPSPPFIPTHTTQIHFCSSELFLSMHRHPLFFPTLSLSMASSLAGLKMRSWRLLMEPARLDRAESEGEGLIPVMAWVTVERSPLWLTAWRLFTKFL